MVIGAGSKVALKAEGVGIGVGVLVDIGIGMGTLAGVVGAFCGAFIADLRSGRVDVGFALGF